MQKARLLNFPVVLLSVPWLLLQLFFLNYFGIVTDFEATKYINQASHFLQTGHYSSANFIFYSVQIQLIVICLKFNVGFFALVLVQMFFNALSIICFYQLVQKFSTNRTIAFLSTAYFLLFFYYHLYNVYLFTESLFFSFSVLYTWFLFTRKHLIFKTALLLLGFLTLLYLTRPTGIFFIPATGLYVILKFYPKQALRILGGFALVILVSFFFLLNVSLGSGGEFDFLLPYLDERIICGVPTLKVPHRIRVPVNSNSIQGLFYIITHHFPLFLKMSLKRLVAFFGVYRAHYSLIHNLFIQTYFYLIYIIILAGIRYLFTHNKPEIWFLIANIAFMAVTVALSCDEWHNRFILCVLPFFLLLAVLAFNNLKKNLNDRKHSVM